MFFFCRYVEDQANKLVRTFTGNLTAMLQTVNTIRPTFDSGRVGRCSSTGGASSAKPSRLAPRESSRTTTGGMGLGAGPAVAAMALGTTRFATEAGASLSKPIVAGGQGLGSTMSVPIKRRTAKDKWIRSMLDNSSNNSSTNNKKQGSAVLAGQGHVAHNQSSAVHMPKGIRLARRTSSREGRRSSGSGTPVRKVVTLNDGVEIMQSTAGACIPEGPENSL